MAELGDLVVGMWTDWFGRVAIRPYIQPVRNGDFAIPVRMSDGGYCAQKVTSEIYQNEICCPVNITGASEPGIVRDYTYLWQPRMRIEGYMDFFGAATDGTYISMRRVSSPVGSTLYVSTSIDHGKTWDEQPINSPPNIGSYYFNTFEYGSIKLMGDDSLIANALYHPSVWSSVPRRAFVRSTDYGHTWYVTFVVDSDDVSDSMPELRNALGSKAIATNMYEYWTTADYGQSWTQHARVVEPGTDWHRLEKAWVTSAGFFYFFRESYSVVKCYLNGTHLYTSSFKDESGSYDFHWAVLQSPPQFGNTVIQVKNYLGDGRWIFRKNTDGMASTQRTDFELSYNAAPATFDVQPHVVMLSETNIAFVCNQYTYLSRDGGQTAFERTPNNIPASYTRGYLIAHAGSMGDDLYLISQRYYRLFTKRGGAYKLRNQ